MYQNYALIVGVHDYRTYDPSGNANVPGARRDARTWVRACLSIGFSPENIRVLTSSPLSVADLGSGATKVTLGEANRASIIDGLRWLSEKIGGDVPASGLMTFSGHGEEGDEGCPLLCPSDTTPSLEEVIDVAVLRQRASATVKDNLTVMLDCCHAQVGVSAADSIRGRLRAKRAGMVVPEEARARVVAACRRDQESVSSRFLGEEMGAFTWAVASTLGQWKREIENDVAYLDVSYGNLLERTQKLLSALSFDQEPVVSGPKGVLEKAFLYPAAARGRGETSTAPTVTRMGRQLDPDFYYVDFYTGDDSYNLANIDVNEQIETWTVASNAASMLSAATELYLRQGSITLSGMTTRETADTAVNWDTTESPPYPTDANTYTFAGDYIYSTGSGTVTGTLAIGFTIGQDRNNAIITTTEWFNPDTSGSNISLQYAPEQYLVLYPVSGSYLGICNQAESTLTVSE